MNNKKGILENKSPKSIVVLNSTHIGTMLCNIPLLFRLKRDFPEAEITVFLVKRNGALKPFLEKMGFKVQVSENLKKFSWYKVLFKTLLSQFKKYDLGISGLLPRKKDQFLLFALSKESLAYTNGKWYKRLLSHPQSFDKNKKNSFHQAQFCVDIWDNSPLKPEEWPHFNDEFSQLLPELKIDFKSSLPKVLIQARNNRTTSKLANEKMGRLLQEAYEQCPFEVILNDFDETEEVKELDRLLKIPRTKVITKDFNQFLALLKQTDFCLVGDGGTSHLAAWLKVPSLVLFGETPVPEWKPLSTSTVCLFDPVDVNNIPYSEILAKFTKGLKSISH